MKDRFTQGYMCAMAAMIRSHGESSPIDEIVSAGFTSLEKLKQNGVPETDIEILMPTLKRIIEARERDKKSDLSSKSKKK